MPWIWTFRMDLSQLFISRIYHRVVHGTPKPTGPPSFSGSIEEVNVVWIAHRSGPLARADPPL